MRNEKATFGQSVRRVEDRALLTGKGRYLDDLQPPGCLSVAFARSPYAHASFTTIDKDAALAMPGVIAVMSHADLAPHLRNDRLVVGLPSAAITLKVDRPVLAIDEVVHVGEPVALVIAENRAAAEDAAEALDIDYEPLDVVSDCRAALEPDSPTVHQSHDHNCLASFGFSFGDVDQAFADAAHIVRRSFDVHRGAAMSLEGRGVLAVPPDLDGVLSVWSSTQTPQALKTQLCQMLGLDPLGIKVRTPDLGGGFGPKLVTYPEEIATTAAALKIGRPLKWVEDRREHFVATAQERDQLWDMEMALEADGRIRGLRGALIHDHGAYTARGLNIPYGSAVTVPLPYNINAYKLDVQVVLTNKVPVAPLRGAGQPQAAFVMERMLDAAAETIGMDRSEIRALNLVRADQMPCVKPLKLRGGTNITLDSGDYPATQALALDKAGWQEFPARQKAALAEGRYLGIGLANYVEGTGRGPYETVSVEVQRTGRILVTTGAAAMGQGTETMLAQIVAEQLGGDMANITVRTGDTTGSLGFGGFNSRQTVVAGASAHQAACTVREKLLAVAADLLEADAADLEIVDNTVALKGVRGRHLPFADLAGAALGLPGFKLPGIKQPGLLSSDQVVIDDMTYSNGTAVAEVEVDPRTGQVCLLNFVLAHDCGRMVNPKLVDGQILGGIAHGIGNALYEQMVFDEDGQPLTTTLADYLLVSAAEMPQIHIVHTESPSPLNALGVKGVGESGVIPTAPAIASAVENALAPFGVSITSAPLSPQTVRRAVRQAGGAA
ncbi:xanthine dehydrogenase family protein molybdopterin-binding subunit [Pseudohoeflea coraliihabitans]|uniref:Xanthine dehydrogenase family protein molybdopterin-binding subunit n=1 Tax=Pseudohoeflea coraliihabitans TaxID=2860393 RepID=A0ABS6WPB4_9HYPH|nr:xanthine dehydrogenase family protein molybdopterin-binding subunit [Pseudohoeflea sp. DP4N28-3]MBW3097242.1 xanthine dehydrogenase family protein molybdopterin-binding subunit [Pseudohoeflea sp. DP4N28-3]